MCFNANVSIVTFIVGLLGCFILIQNKKENYIPEAIFYLWVIQMQLVEFILWKNQPCNKNNIKITTIGIIINHMEPIILWLAILLFSTKKLPSWVNYTLLFYLFYSIFYSISAIKHECTNVTSESSPHLYWKWNNKNGSSIYYGLFLFCLIILSIYGLKFGYHQAILISFSFALSGIIYGKYKSTGAMWCFAAAFAPIITPYFYKIKL